MINCIILSKRLKIPGGYINVDYSIDKYFNIYIRYRKDYEYDVKEWSMPSFIRPEILNIIRNEKIESIVGQD